jgi:hypothetical protein
MELKPKVDTGGKPIEDEGKTEDEGKPTEDEGKPNEDEEKPKSDGTEGIERDPENAEVAGKLPPKESEEPKFPEPKLPKLEVPPKLEVAPKLGEPKPLRLEGNMPLAEIPPSPAEFETAPLSPFAFEGIPKLFDAS